MTPDTHRSDSARTRPAKPPLSREAIVHTALLLIDESGIDAVSMRKVATRLDTAAASLYVYVADRKDLLEAAYDLALADVPVGHGEPADWRAELEGLVTDQIHVLATHDDIALVALVEAQVGPNALAITERVLALLRRGGLAEGSLLAAADLLDQYTASTAVERASWARRVRAEAERADVSDASMQAARNRLGRVYDALPETEFPEIRALRAQLDESDPDDRHRWKLGAIITGITS
ncbi:TetR/AcrR family transcriptional regulator C-terminal domain-containing protein [Curtobacterium sp. PhB136]|uniref:TetR/AcrR family transcriptional regulator n=1 Tax=Curtobacterium sp. PhB136 TaxID=2485181 RepID=UPI001051BFB6|nr:TetR/AcrR family transcriptional regulator C-terminal domain-containing protein [Curtobacterium sp. PhB136]TCK61371.1 TetR family transcriptional regulator [Curtobacterium sp. PhB136]